MLRLVGLAATAEPGDITITGTSPNSNNDCCFLACLFNLIN
ncbi:MAG: hypothetical protein BWY93_02231 [Euryarchaeota archaeon ADurb.BinA087]|nr:MAG: hypothetical protein BWY93_02231 [Euryarchaeota archaeon ADurb.BinA087]